jgi:hypothetical protein
VTLWVHSVSVFCLRQMILSHLTIYETQFFTQRKEMKSLVVLVHVLCEEGYVYIFEYVNSIMYVFVYVYVCIYVCIYARVCV